MATLSVKTIANNCFGKTAPLSIREDILGVYGNDNPQTRSLRQRLELIENEPFVRIALVTIQGAAPNVQRDLDIGNTVWQEECDAWVYCVGSITVTRPNLLVLEVDDCGDPHSVSAEEDELFDLGRDLGANIVGYYISDSNVAARGCAAFPPGRRGFWAADSATQFTLIHELTHVVGNNPHVSDSDNLMFEGGTASITNPPPDLTAGQCQSITSDVDMESC